MPVVFGCTLDQFLQFFTSLRKRCNISRQLIRSSMCILNARHHRRDTGGTRIKISQPRFHAANLTCQLTQLGNSISIVIPHQRCCENPP